MQSYDTTEMIPESDLSIKIAIEDKYRGEIQIDIYQEDIPIVRGISIIRQPNIQNQFLLANIPAEINQLQRLLEEIARELRSSFEYDGNTVFIFFDNSIQRQSYAVIPE